MTAVEKLVDQLTSIGVLEIPQGSNVVTEIIKQAEEMEKEQMIDFACKVVEVSAEKYIQGKTTEQIAKELIKS